MQTNEANELAYIEKNSNALWKIAHNFAKLSKGMADAEDLYQEGVIVLLQYYRQAKDERALRLFPTKDIQNAVCRYLVGQQVVNFPKRTQDFTARMRETKRLPIHLAKSGSRTDEDDWIRSMDFQRYLDSLPADTVDMMQCRVAGYSNNDIAARHNLTPGAVTHRMRRIYQGYQEAVA